MCVACWQKAHELILSFLEWADGAYIESRNFLTCELCNKLGCVGWHDIEKVNGKDVMEDELYEWALHSKQE